MVVDWAFIVVEVIAEGVIAEGLTVVCGVLTVVVVDTKGLAVVIGDIVVDVLTVGEVTSPRGLVVVDVVVMTTDLDVVGVTLLVTLVGVDFCVEVVTITVLVCVGVFKVDSPELDSLVTVVDAEIVEASAGAVVEFDLPRAEVTAIAVIGFLVVTSLPFLITVLPTTVLVIVAELTVPGRRSLLLELPSFVLLESLSFLFRFGFFMFLTTLPLDFTGALLVFIGIVAIRGFGNTSGMVDGAAEGVFTSTSSEPAVTDCIVDGISGMGVLDCVVGTIVFSVVDDSQWLLHLHGLLFSIGKPKQSIKINIHVFIIT